MWGVYPEARDWNVGAVCSDFNLCGHILRKAPGALKFGTKRKKAKLGTSGPFYQDTLAQNKIYAQAANIPVSFLWIDSPHAYVWTS